MRGKENIGTLQRIDQKVFDNNLHTYWKLFDIELGLNLWFIIYNKLIYLFMSTFTSKYKSTPTFSFKGRHNTITSYNDPAVLPSPNAYNPEKVSLNNSPAAKFPKSLRKQWAQITSRKNLPGPGAHQFKSYITQGPKKTISKLLFKHIIPLTPSPGLYNSDVSILKNKQPSFSIKKRTLSMLDLVVSKNLDKPSPVHYEQPIIKFKSSTSITMGKSSRRSLGSSEKYPGPGSYQASKSFSQSILSDKKCKIGKDARKINFSLGQRSPGPVKYDKKGFVQINIQKSRGYSCRAKMSVPEQINPGPGQYETPIIKNFHSAPVIKMPKSARVSFTDKNIKILENNPGPGSFDTKGIERIKFHSMSVHKFSKDKKSYISQTIRNQSSLSLAPGSYNANNFFIKKQSPKFSIGHSPNRQLLNKIPKLPGPSDYDPKVSLIFESQMNHKMQKSQRGNVIKHLMNFPGPGEYELPANERLGRKFKFPKDKRRNYNETKIKHQKSTLHQTYEQRQLFPNPPKYMGVVSKLKFNEHKLKKN